MVIVLALVGAVISFFVWGAIASSAVQVIESKYPDYYIESGLRAERATLIGRRVGTPLDSISFSRHDNDLISGDRALRRMLLLAAVLRIVHLGLLTAAVSMIIMR